MTRRVPLHLALSGYHHTDALASGTVPVEGVDLTVLTYPVEEIFFRFTRFREWHVSEMSFAKYIALRSRGDESLVGLPVFPSRVFRHSSIYVRDGGPATPTGLAGARIGLPEWAQTAAVYSRGLIAHEFGIPLRDIDWYQAGLSQPGRAEKVEVNLPDGVKLTRVPDRSLDEMLCSGDLDAVLTAHAPPSFEAGSAGIRRLFPDHASVEREYGLRTGVFPIMHLVVLRADVYQEYPWLAANLVSAFDAAKELSLHQLTEVTASRLPLPWADVALCSANGDLFAGEHWPYGIEPNMRTLEFFCRCAYEQGVAARLMCPEELFAPQTHGRFRI